MPALLPFFGPKRSPAFGPQASSFFSYAGSRPTVASEPTASSAVGHGRNGSTPYRRGYSYRHPSPTRVADPGTARPERSSRFCLGDQGVVCVSAESLNVVRRAQTTHRKIPCVGLDAPVAISIFFRSFFRGHFRGHIRSHFPWPFPWPFSVAIFRGHLP